MTKILPAVTHPWREKIARRHTPRVFRGKRGFQSYRPCLRWEFGFSCAFCLCHERDLAAYGTEGTALTHVEHFVPQSRDEKGRNDYRNCFYSCRLCNVPRGAQPNEDDQGRSLLNPCDHAWGTRFVVVRDQIHPRDEHDADAAYTAKAYELNAPPKVRMRKIRRMVIGQCIRFLQRTRSHERHLLDLAEAGGGTRCVDIARDAAAERTKAYSDLLRFRAVPHDRNAACGCGHTWHHRLPRALEEQTIDLSGLRSQPR
jgi:hypothetical protein